ncbi:MAG TPA: hypothetical protein VKU89_00010 [Solirubrobacteraceae bacterium]|nr:hypothetical protein [Solirubrobacteraceae bacterium]
MIDELSALTRNTIGLADAEATFYKLSEPTAIEARALRLVETAPVSA